MLNHWQNMGRNARVMAIALIVWALGEGLWTYLQPLYLESLGASPEQIGGVLALGGLARLVVMLPSGLLADKFGARRMLVPGWMLGTTGVILLAIAPNLTVAALGMVVYGLSASAIPVINLYLVQSIQADRTMTRPYNPQEMLTFVNAMFWMGLIVSPTIGGLIAEATSLRAVFGISAVWFGVSTLVLLQTEDYPIRTNSHWRHIMRDYGLLLRQRRLLGLYVIFGLAFIALILGYGFAPKYLQDVHRLSNGEIGILGSMLALGGFVWNIVFSQRDMWGSFGWALAMSAVALVLILSTPHMIVLVVAYFLFGAWEILRPVSTSIIAKYTTPAQHGVAFSMVDTLHGLGMFVAPSAAGFLYASDARYPFWLALVLLPIVGGLIMLLRRAEHLHKQEKGVLNQQA